MTDLTLDLQIATTATALPSADQLRDWVSAVMSADAIDLNSAELSVRLVDIDESQALNHQYRGKDKPTNVLSFPAELPEGVDLPLLGDLVICAPVVADEACQQNKALNAHWAHMLIHGTLHLLGFDHIEDTEAEEMEQLETQLLIQLGFPAPYEHYASTSTS